MNRPFFSLILPIYNVEKYLGRCIESILEQNFDDYEMILVDDGATDTCPQICDEYEQKYEKISVVHKVNGGLSSARNAGFEKARGEYIFWIDSDDWLEPDSLLFLLEEIKKYNYPDIVKFDHIKRPGGENGIADLKEGIVKKEQIRKELIPKCLLHTGSVNFSIWSHVYKREYILKNELTFVSEREIGSEDYLYNFEAYMCANEIVVLHKSIYNYDFREGSLTNRYRDKLILQYQNLQEQMIEAAKRKECFSLYREVLAESYIKRCFNVCMRNECVTNQNHTILEGLRKSKKMIAHPLFRQALKDSSYIPKNKSEKVKRIFMKLNIVYPLMYLHIRSLKN